MTASLQLLRADGESSEESRLTSKPRRLVAPQDRSSTAPPKAHAPPATTATETARAPATTMTVFLREPVTVEWC